MDRQAWKPQFMFTIIIFTSFFLKFIVQKQIFLTELLFSINIVVSMVTCTYCLTKWQTLPLDVGNTCPKQPALNPLNINKYRQPLIFEVQVSKADIGIGLLSCFEVHWTNHIVFFNQNERLYFQTPMWLAAKMKGWLYLVLFCCMGFFLQCVEMKKEKKHVSSDVDRVLFALKKAVMFFEQSGNNLNLDAYFGLRIAQGW